MTGKVIHLRGGIASNVDTTGEWDERTLGAANAQMKRHGLIEDADRKAKVAMWAQELTPQVISRFTEPIYDKHGQPTTHVTPKWVTELTPKDLKRLPRLPVVAWIDDPAWPWRFRPAFDNNHSWSMVIGGAACVRCAIIHELAWPDVCGGCGLPVKVHRDTLQLMEDRLNYARSGFLASQPAVQKHLAEAQGGK